jgi:hypothetical protein
VVTRVCQPFVSPWLVFPRSKRRCVIVIGPYGARRIEDLVAVVQKGIDHRVLGTPAILNVPHSFDQGILDGWKEPKGIMRARINASTEGSTAHKRTSAG